MAKVILSRLGALAVILLALSAIVFALEAMIPADPVRAMVGASATKEAVAAKRHELQEECIRNGWLTPKVIYGYFPCSAKGNDLTVLDPQSRQPIWTFNFPRKIETPRHCLADYFSEDDVVAFQAVTVGDRATQLCAEWEAAGEFTRSYFLHGLAVETAEAMAEYWHRRVRAEMGIPPTQGKRYSAGYPAWPDLADQRGVWAILHPERIGMTLTEAHQMVPEQSTSAIIAWHPECSYYAVRTVASVP